MAAITQELCGHEFSASSISTITARLETQLAEFSRRRLAEEFPFVVLDARYEAGAGRRGDREPGDPGGTGH